MERRKVAIYARVSTQKQGEEDKASIPEQIARIEKYCEGRGYTIADRYVDIGHSGSTKKRPEFQRMLKDIKQGNIDAVVCWKSDRLARGMYPAAALMEVIEPLGVGLEAVEEHLDMNYFAILAVVGKIELDNLRLRTSMGSEKRAKDGLHPGGHRFPYGYKKTDEGKLVVNQPEAEWIKHLFQWVDDGNSAMSWCKYANTHGFVSRHDSIGVTPQQVSLWLRNPVYKGEYHWGKQRKGRRNITEADHIIIPVEPTVSADQWERVQQKLARNRSWSKGNTKKFYMLQKLMYCAECGKLFICGFAGDKPTRYYQCRGTRIYPHMFQCRKPHTINADLLEEWVWNEITDRVRSLAKYDDIVDVILAEFEQQKENIIIQLEKEREALKKCAIQRQIIAKRERQQYLTAQEAELQYRAIQSEQEMHELEINKLEKMSDEKDPLIFREMMERIKWLDRAYNWFGHAEISPEQRREFLLNVVDRITIDGNNKVDIRLKLEVPGLVNATADISRNNQSEELFSFQHMA